jgi:hypothetical protein
MLGSLGEFVGAIAVVATLVYLAIQVRHSKEAMEANTKSLDEGRKLALAQTYQARSDALQQMQMFLAASQELCEITEKIDPERASAEEYRTAYQNLTPVEQRRWRYFQHGHAARMDNLLIPVSARSDDRGVLHVRNPRADGFLRAGMESARYCR